MVANVWLTHLFWVDWLHKLFEFPLSQELVGGVSEEYPQLSKNRLSLFIDLCQLLTGQFSWLRGRGHR